MSGKSDFFADIAAKRDTVKSGLVSHPAPTPDPRPLRLDASAPAFAPAPRLETAAQLSAALAELRARTAPFLRELAPPLPSPRTRTALVEWEWRAGDPDLAVSASALHAEPASAWTRVRLPHFGGPIGRATSYYRATVSLAALPAAGQRLFFTCGEADYIAEVYVNGCLVGRHEGFFAAFDFDITAAFRPGENQLLVRLDNDAILMGNDWCGQDQEGDKIYAATGLGWDDPALGWHHCPPGMGLVGPVHLETRAEFHFGDVWVRPLSTAGSVELWLDVVGTRPGPPRPVSFRVSVHGRNFEARPVHDLALPAAEPARKGPTTYRYRLDLPDARAWNLDTPWLYSLHAVLLDGEGRVLDTAATHFGLRTFELREDTEPKGKFFLNGDEIRLRGANTMGSEQQAAVHGDHARLVDDILLAKLCHMNFWRFTQRPVQPVIYDTCSRLGLLTQTDLPLFAVIRRDRIPEILRQTAEMIRHVRPHASHALVSYINEPFPNSWGKSPERYHTREDLEAFMRAADELVRIHAPGQAIKPIDGDYDSPGPGLPDNHCYTLWYNGHLIDFGRVHRGEWLPIKPDWNCGCGEFGIEGLDCLDLMRRRYPADWLPRADEPLAAWSPKRIIKAQSHEKHFCLFETPESAQAWVETTRAHQAWGTRHFTEALRRNPRMVTFAIHLFIDAFPAGWMKTIMDCERAPKPAYFAYRDALSPTLVSLRTDRFAWFGGDTATCEAWLCHDPARPLAGALLRYQLETASGQSLGGGALAFDAPACSVTSLGVLELPLPRVETRALFRLRARAETAEGALLHESTLDLEAWPLPAATPAAPADPVFLDASSAAPLDDLLLPALAAGATVVVSGLPAGQHRIAGQDLKIVQLDKGERHFVSSRTGHPWVAALRPDDLRYLYHEGENRIAPLVGHACLPAEPAAWRTVLRVHNNVGDTAFAATGDWQPVPVLLERALDQGRLVVTTCDLQAFAKNPAIATLLSHLTQRP